MDQKVNQHFLGSRWSSHRSTKTHFFFQKHWETDIKGLILYIKKKTPKKIKVSSYTILYKPDHFRSWKQNRVWPGYSLGGRWLNTLCGPHSRSLSLVGLFLPLPQVLHQLKATLGDNNSCPSLSLWKPQILLHTWKDLQQLTVNWSIPSFLALPFHCTAFNCQD